MWNTYIEKTYRNSKCKKRKNDCCTQHKYKHDDLMIVTLDIKWDMLSDNIV